MERFDLPLPGRIHRLDELAMDVWWSWNHDARELFKRLDVAKWRTPSSSVSRVPSSIFETMSSRPSCRSLSRTAVTGSP